MNILQGKDDSLRVEWTQVMCRTNTPVVLAGLRLALACLVAGGLSLAPAQALRARAEWRHIGNSSQLLGLPSPAGGPVERAWFGADGRLMVRLPGGRTFSSSDLETWQADSAQPPVISSPAPAGAVPPEADARIVATRSGDATVYAAGQNAWRSEDGGLNWRNLTSFRGASLLGSALRDLAVDPNEPQRIVASTANGVWLSADGGLSWQGLNEGLPNLPVRRIVAAPAGSRGVRIAVAAVNDPSSDPRELEWAPGQSRGWELVRENGLAAEMALRRSLSALLGAEITSAASAGDTVYAGSADGRLFASLDGGRSWRNSEAGQRNGSVERVILDPSDRNFAVAALSASGSGAPRVLRTLNAGVYWDDLTSNLPDGPVYGVAVDRASGALYAATPKGVFITLADLRAPAQATPWQSLSAGLPQAAVRDVRLDDAGNLLLAAVDGYGVFAALAPHRQRSPVLVHSADYTQRPAAPGALLTVLGARVSSAAASVANPGAPSGQAVTAPVLAATDLESQIQVPFEATGESLQVVVNAPQGRVVFGLPLQTAAPAILVDRDGSPMLIDADSGIQLDAMHPARPGMRLQVLMSGLGRVQPDWPTGLAAPLEDAPRVVASLRATVDGSPVQIVRATLAPGYIGYYLVEVQLPEFVDAGASELLIEAAGRASNRVRLYLSQ